MKVSFGIINYNRLFYLKSCAESLMESVKEYDNVEFICIDDNSREEGTEEYLKSLEDRGWRIINQEDYREKPKQEIGIVKQLIDEYSAALNIFYKESSGDIIAPLQGDMQFIRKDWLKEYVALFTERDDVIAAMFDAQRRVRLEQNQFEKVEVSNATFGVNPGRIIPGAGDCFYSREALDAMGGWKVGEQVNAEDLFTYAGSKIFGGKKRVFVPWVPVAAAIYTDPRGTMGRVRGNVRYGIYWEALSDNRYYEWLDEEAPSALPHRPLSIEEVVSANGDWELPVDENGNWKKNPINWPHEKNVPHEVIY